MLVKLSDSLSLLIIHLFHPTDSVEIANCMGIALRGGGGGKKMERARVEWERERESEKEEGGELAGSEILLYHESDYY
ncbi:MAG: hypothetical protein MJE68_05625 [Proteobacteria bacterium]|nr:hypothetical protein [Pseudomonadota bacterium]